MIIIDNLLNKPGKGDAYTIHHYKKGLTLNSITKGSCQIVCHNISSDVIKIDVTTYFELQICIKSS